MPTEKDAAAQPAAEKPARKPAAEKPAAEKPAAEKKAAGEPAAEKKAAGKPVAEKKAPARSAAAEAAAGTEEKRDVAPARGQILKAHHLRPAAGAKKDKMRVGRGEGSKGKTAGRGTKGTKARYQVRAGLEGGNLNAVMRAPKLRGFKNPFRVEYQVVNVQRLAELYPHGGEVTVADLVAKGAVRKNEKVKVLGAGDIAVALRVEVDKVSASAQQKIVAAGGSVA